MLKIAIKDVADEITKSHSYNIESITKKGYKVRNDKGELKIYEKELFKDLRIDLSCIKVQA